MFVYVVWYSQERFFSYQWNENSRDFRRISLMIFIPRETRSFVVFFFYLSLDGLDQSVGALYWNIIKCTMNFVTILACATWQGWFSVDDLNRHTRCFRCLCRGTASPRSTNEYKIIFRSWVPKIDFFWIIRVHHSAYSFEESRSVALCWSSAFKHIISIGSVHSLWLQ